MVDGAGRIVRTNARLAQMFGYEQQELDGQPLETLLPERLRIAHAQHRRGFFSDPRVRPMGSGLELTARRKDGTEFPVEISLSFVESQQGLLALGFVTDITPRRNAEQRLHAEFLVTRVFAEPDASEESASAPASGSVREPRLGSRGILARGRRRPPARGGMASVGAGHEGVRRSQPQDGAVMRDGAGRPGLGDRPGMLGQVGRAASLGGRATAAARLGLKPACAFPIRGQDTFLGAIVMLNRAPREPDDTLLAMLTDIGNRIGQHLDHRRVQTELRQQREVLFQSEKLSALGRLVAGVAHEMNNPLGIISSRIELMLGEAEDQAIPAQFLEDLRVVHRNVMRVAGVAQALRSFARQSTGERRPVDLNTVVAETLLLVGKSMSTEDVRITTALDSALPSILGDANALQQVLLNLLTNAREALTGGGEISIRTGRDSEHPGHLHLIVKDTGPGIPSAHLPHLFEPFYTTKPSGTGLGLAVSYGIVQSHLGTIDVHSLANQGATFTLRFPILENLPSPA